MLLPALALVFGRREREILAAKPVFVSSVQLARTAHVGRRADALRGTASSACAARLPAPPRVVAAPASSLVPPMPAPWSGAPPSSVLPPAPAAPAPTARPASPPIEPLGLPPIALPACAFTPAAPPSPRYAAMPAPKPEVARASCDSERKVSSLVGTRHFKHNPIGNSGTFLHQQCAAPRRENLIFYRTALGTPRAPHGVNQAMSVRVAWSIHKVNCQSSATEIELSK